MQWSWSHTSIPVGPTRCSPHHPPPRGSMARQDLSGCWSHCCSAIPESREEFGHHSLYLVAFICPLCAVGPAAALQELPACQEMFRVLRSRQELQMILLCPAASPSPSCCTSSWDAAVELGTFK